MTRVLLAFVLVAAPALASAQTEGRIGLGLSTTVNVTTDGEVGTGVGVGVLVRLNPRAGWGASGAFNWLDADMSNPAGTPGEFARLRIRPLMAGVSYNVVTGRLLTSFSVVGGPSFNSARFDERFPGSALAAIDVSNSVALRPGIGLTYSLRPRVALVGFGGYMLNRPDIRYRDSSGTEFRNQWRADAVVLSIGAVYSLF
ncbi:MAG: outer membrane beta-barrel protein [Vicinamibacterales bacterium]